jgi:hypothetical protein
MRIGAGKKTVHEIFPGIFYLRIENQEEIVSKKDHGAFPVALALIVIGWLSAISLPAQSLELCCIAGEYKGFQVNYAKPNCPAPVKEKFTMVIHQMKPCSASIRGTIVDSSGTLNHWTGSLRRGLRRCCLLEGSIVTPGGNTVNFKGTICQRLGKWQIKGTWEEIGSTDPCRGSGTWQAAQD